MSLACPYPPPYPSRRRSARRRAAPWRWVHRQETPPVREHPFFENNSSTEEDNRTTRRRKTQKRRDRERAEEVRVETTDNGDRWTTWDQGQHGPKPFPDWLVTDLAATDTELGVLKTGKEADVHLIERSAPDGRSCLLAAKRYRSNEHRMFHRDAGYLEGRRVRRSRETRAMANRTTFGRDLMAQQWAAAEFSALATLWSLGAPVPYPVQLVGTEVQLEFLGHPDGRAADRLEALRPDPDELVDLWEQLVAAVVLLAGNGIAHGDLSPFNIVIHHGRLILIDLPQVVDVIANPQGVNFLDRDLRVMSEWFAARGLPADLADLDALRAVVHSEAGLRPW
ncbi:hypothetical protein D5S17_01280 [Pseudonocardiaceae bacterium YIM PH 21723]|nr:hypothetical protein D5S17_01280 [Pseudonocardiaceae bacterium YIM PH 21723]